MPISNSKLRTLFIASVSVYPPLRGAPLRNWQNVTAMMEHGPVALFAVSVGTAQKRPKPPGISYWHHEDIPWIGEPIAESRIELNLKVLYSKTADLKLKQLLHNFCPDLVIFEEIWTYSYLPTVKDYPCHIVLDNHNVEIEIYRQTLPEKLKRRSDLKQSTNIPLEYERMQLIEQDFIRNVNQVWLCSQNDAELLVKNYGECTNTYVIPNTIDTQFYKDVWSRKHSPIKQLEPKIHNIIFIGMLGYLPNKEAVQILVEDIYPKLKVLYPGCNLLLVGQKADEMQQIYGQVDGVLFTGKVPDVRPYWASASVLVAPLFKGGGTRLKILEAFAAGCPVVTTQKGAEGLDAVDGLHLLIRETTEEMVDAVVQLWSSPELVERLIHSAYQLVQEKYSWQAARLKIKEAIAQLPP